MISNERFEKIFRGEHYYENNKGWRYPVTFSDKYEPIVFDWYGDQYRWSDTTPKVMLHLKGFYLHEYAYTWGGYPNYDITFNIDSEMFDEDMTDEEIVNKFIEKLKASKYAHLLKEKHDEIH